MTLDIAARSAALKTIAKFGKSITLTRVTEGAYNTATATTTNTPVDETVSAIVEDYKGFDLTSGLIQAGDKKVTVAASAVAIPALADKITVDAYIYTIVNIQTIYSGQLAALYILQGRAA